MLALHGLGIRVARFGVTRTLTLTLSGPRYCNRRKRQASAVYVNGLRRPCGSGRVVMPWCCCVHVSRVSFRCTHSSTPVAALRTHSYPKAKSKGKGKGKDKAAGSVTTMVGCLLRVFVWPMLYHSQNTPFRLGYDKSQVSHV